MENPVTEVPTPPDFIKDRGLGIAPNRYRGKEAAFLGELSTGPIFLVGVSRCTLRSSVHPDLSLN